jgi:hypothetical protein
MDPSVIKALLMATAYEGALAVCGNLETVSGGIPVNLDPLIKDQGMQQKGIAVYEEAKVQYAVLVQAFQDKTGIWPDPQLPASTAKAPVTAALQALTQNPSTNIATLAQQLLAAVQAAATAATQAAPAKPSAPSNPVPALGGAATATS